MEIWIVKERVPKSLSNPVDSVLHVPDVPIRKRKVGQSQGESPAEGPARQNLIAMRVLRKSCTHAKLCVDFSLN